MFFLFILSFFLFVPVHAAEGVLDTEEADFITRLNTLRQISGLKPLALDPSLEKAARFHTQYLVQLGDLTHTETDPAQLNSWDRIASAGGHFLAAGENIARGNASGLKTFNQWLHSPGHLENMLSERYQYIGIARLASKPLEGSTRPDYFWTTDFGGQKETSDDPGLSPALKDPEEENVPDQSDTDDSNMPEETSGSLPSWRDVRNWITPYLPHPH